jgi:TrmH family RNA methyltransferase
MESISSRHNPIVKTFRALAQGGDDALLLEGVTLVQEALGMGVRMRTVAFSARLLAHVDDRTRQLVDALAKTGARLLSVSPALMGAMSPVRTPSGVVAIADRTRVPLDLVFAGTPPLVLVLDGLQDPGNVGAVIRAADAAGATGIVACEHTADPFGWKALRGAMGSTFRLPVATDQPAERAVAAARTYGLRVLAATPRGGRPMHDVDLRIPTAILLGAEGAGLQDQMEQLADERISVPMRAPVESLNVAVSAALVVYEAYRQRHDR